MIGDTVVQWLVLSPHSKKFVGFIPGRRMNSEVFWPILSPIQPNASELTELFTGLMDNDPTHTAKATKDFFFFFF